MQKWVENISAWASNYSSFMWGMPLLILLVGGGLYFLILSRFLPFRYFGHAVSVLRGKYDDPNDPGQINHFEAFSYLWTLFPITFTAGLMHAHRYNPSHSVHETGKELLKYLTFLIGLIQKYTNENL